MSILVTNAEEWICLNVCRSLGKKGIGVDVASHRNDAMTFHSKYRRRKYTYSDPSASEKKFVRDIVDIIKNKTYEFLVSTNDVTLMTISSNRDKIGKYVDLPLPSHETLEICDNKSKTIEMAEKLDIPCPKTFFVRDISDIKDVAKDIDFPVVIKPFRGQGARGVSFVQTPEMLEEQYKKTKAVYGDAMIQEYIKGVRYNLGVIFNYKHEPKRLALWKTIRFVGGITIFGETVEQPKVLKLGLKFLKKIRYFGVGIIDFIMDEKDNRPKLMEINPRFAGNMTIPIEAGVDFPYLLYRMLKDGDIEKNFNYKKEVCSRHLMLDLKHLFTVLSGNAPYNYHTTKKRTLINFIKSFSCTSDYLFSVDDPKPGIIELKKELIDLTSRKLN